MIRTISFCLFALIIHIHVFGEESFFVLVPDRTNQQLRSISVYKSAEGVSIKDGEALSVPFEPRSITVHPNGKHLFVSGGTEETTVATVEILKGGQLSLSALSVLAQPGSYTSVDRSGRYFMMADYRTGTISVYPIDKQGKAGDEVCSLKTPKAEAHCILTTRDNRFAYIPCVKNNNALYQFAFGEKTGQLTPLEPFNAFPPAMFGPRHIAYHPNLPIAYFSNEQQLGVSVFEIGTDGQLADRQHATTMPRRSPFEPGKRDLHASDLVVSPDGKLLFVAVRDFNSNEDSVFSFQVETDGKLSQTARTKVGDIPWKIDLSPSGDYLIVSESGDSRLSLYKVLSKGALRKTVSLELPSGATDMSVVGL